MTSRRNPIRAFLRAPARVIGPALVVAGATAWVPAPATAASEAQIVITINSLAPAVATGNEDVEVAGTVTNRGGADADIPEITLQGADTPLAGRAAVAAWASGTTSGVPPASLRTYDTAAGPDRLSEGESHGFRLTLPKAAARTTAAYGALPLLVRAGDTVRTTFAAVHNRKEYEQLRVAVVTPVTLDPEPGLFESYGAGRLASWRTELADDGRINRLLDATKDLPVTWAFDPTLLAPPEAIAQERPTDPEAGTAWDRIGPEQREETALRIAFDAALRDRLPGRSVAVLPYADPDLAAVLADPGLTDRFAALRAKGEAVADGIPGARSDIAWPADGLLATSRVAAITELYGEGRLGAVIGSEAALGADNTLAAPHPGGADRAGAGVAALAYDDGLSNALLDLESDPSGAITTQRLLADSLAALAEYPGTPRSLLIATPRTLDARPGALHRALSGLLDAPWITRGDLDDLIDEAPGGTPLPADPAAELALPSGIPADPSTERLALTASRARTVASALKAIDATSQVRDDGAVNGVFWDEVADQLLSSRWRADRGALRIVLGELRDAGIQADTAVAVVPERINFFADSGLLQVTVTNDLDVPVRQVRVHLTPLAPSFRLTEMPEPVDIGAHSRATVRVPATALAAGTVPVKVSLYSPQSQHIGVDNTVQVRAYPTGSWFYWVIGAVAAALVAAGVLRSRRRRKA